MKKALLLLSLAAALLAQSSGVGSNWTVVTGTLQSAAVANGNGSALPVQGLSSVAVTVNCSVACSAGTTITFQVSQDGTNYEPVLATRTDAAVQSTTVVNQGTTPTIWTIPTAGMQLIRAPISAYSVGTITVTATAVASTPPQTATQALQSGTWNVGGLGAAGSPIGGVVSVQGVASGTAQPVSGTFWQTTQPVSGTFWQTTQPVSGTFWQTTQPVSIASMPSTPVTGTFWQTTQPVSWSSQSVSLTGSWPYSGTLGAVTQASGPWTFNLTQVDGTALGAPSNYGTSPGAVAVSGVNAYVTNVPAVSQSGNWTARVVGNTGGVVDAAAGATAAGNSIEAGCVYNSSAPGPSTGQQEPCQLDSAGNLLVNLKTALPTGTNTIGSVKVTDGTNTYQVDPCQGNVKLWANINLTASGQIITGTSSKKTYICSLDIVTATTQNIALVEGTGTTCASSTAGMAGGTTAATGWNFGTNGGLSKGNGAASVYAASNTAADNVCLLLSGSGQTSGQMSYVQQ